MRKPSIKRIISLFKKSKYMIIAPGYRNVGDEETEGLLRLLFAGRDLGKYYAFHKDTLAIDRDFAQFDPLTNHGCPYAKDCLFLGCHESRNGFYTEKYCRHLREKLE
jgi:hypothetical protein|tara:strand:- start:433 stop:753 length:321 start_codon:yes stop_codon:yes gene_type:complete